MTTYDIYGLSTKDLKLASMMIEKSLDIKFRVRESLYRGGEYYQLGLNEEENFILQLNFNPLEQEWTEEEFKEMGSILYVNNTNRSEELRKYLNETYLDIQLLQQRKS
jgi:hypothetical protein